MLRKIFFVAIFVLMTFFMMGATVQYWSARNLKAETAFYVGSKNVFNFLDGLVSNQTVTNSIGDGTITLPKLSSSVQNLLNVTPSNTYVPDDVTLALEISGSDTTLIVKNNGIGDAQLQDTFNVAQDTTKLKLENGVNGKQLYLKQLSSSNTSGGGSFVWKLSGYSADGGSVFAGAGGYWVRSSLVENNYDYHASWWGANPLDSNDDTDALQKAITTINEKTYNGRKGGTLNLESGVYLADSLYLLPFCNLKGQGMINGTRISYNGSSGGTWFYVDSIGTATPGLKVEGISFVKGTNSPDYIFRFRKAVDFATTFFDCQFQGAKSAIKTDEGWINFHVSHCRFDDITGYTFDLKPSSFQGERIFSLTNFTWDNGTSGGSLLRINAKDNENETGKYLIANARIEKNSDFSANVDSAYIWLISRPNPSKTPQFTFTIMNTVFRESHSENPSVIHISDSTGAASDEIALVVINSEISPGNNDDFLENTISYFPQGNKFDMAVFSPAHESGIENVVYFLSKSKPRFRNIQVDTSIALNSTTFADFLSASVTVDLPAIPVDSVRSFKIYCPGVTTGGKTNVTVNPATNIESGLVWSSFVSDTDSIKVQVHNGSGAILNPANRNWTAIAFKRE